MTSLFTSEHSNLRTSTPPPHTHTKSKTETKPENKTKTQLFVVFYVTMTAPIELSSPMLVVSLTLCSGVAVRNIQPVAAIVARNYTQLKV